VLSPTMQTSSTYSHTRAVLALFLYYIGSICVSQVLTFYPY